MVRGFLNSQLYENGIFMKGKIEITFKGNARIYTLQFPKHEP